MGPAQSTMDWFSKSKRKDSTLSLWFFKWMIWKCELLRQHPNWWKRLPCSWSFAMMGGFWTSMIVPQTTVSANLESFSLWIKWSNMEVFSLLCLTFHLIPKILCMSSFIHFYTFEFMNSYSTKFRPNCLVCVLYLHAEMEDNRNLRKTFKKETKYWLRRKQDAVPESHTLLV